MLAAGLSATVILFGSMLFFDKTDVSAKPGGKIEITYGAPIWNDSREGQISPNLTWRLGSGGATTLETQAGLIFDDLVIFPGTYNLALNFESDDYWKMIFHHDGTFYGGKSNEGQSRFPHSRVDGKAVTKKLEIEIDATKTPGVYRWRVTYGPRRIEKEFTSAKAKTVPGKAGGVPVEMTILERTDLDRLKEDLKKDQVLVAKIQRKGKDVSDVYRLLLREEPLRLEVDDVAGEAVPKLLDGEKRQPTAAGKAFSASLDDVKDGAQVAFLVDDNEYVFTLPKDLFERSKDSKDAKSGRDRKAGR